MFCCLFSKIFTNSFWIEMHSTFSSFTTIVVMAITTCFKMQTKARCYININKEMKRKIDLHATHLFFYYKNTEYIINFFYKNTYEH